jgi:hypothetical protein
MGGSCFRPETEALSEMARLVELGRLSLPIGIRAPLRDAPKAFDHVRRHAPGRALPFLDPRRGR